MRVEIGVACDTYGVGEKMHTWRKEAIWKTGRWKDNIKMDLKEAEFETVDCINLAQDR